MTLSKWPKKIGIACICVFGLCNDVHAEDLTSYQSKYKVLEQEKDLLSYQLHQLEVVQEQLRMALEDQGLCTIDLNALPFKQFPKIFIDLFLTYEGSVRIVLQRKWWQNDFVDFAGSIPLNIPGMYRASELQEKLAMLSQGHGWVTLDYKPHALMIKAPTQAEIKVYVDPHLSERVREIRSESVLLKQAIDRKEQQKQSSEDALFEDQFWQSEYLGKAPREYIKSVQAEIAAAEASPYQAAKLPWYLQILRSLKRSGYRFEDQNLESELLGRIWPLLPKSLSQAELYNHLKWADGVSRVIKHSGLEPFELPSEQLQDFLNGAMEHFLVREEGAFQRETNYFVRFKRFEDLWFWLNSGLKQHSYFVDERFASSRRDLIQFFEQLHASAGRLRKRSSANVSFRIQHEKLFQLSSEVLFRHGQLQGSTSSLFPKMNQQKKLELVLQALVFQDILFEQVPAPDLSQVKAEQALQWQDHPQVALALKDFWHGFKRQDFVYAGLGRSASSLFSRPWSALLRNLLYVPQTPYPLYIAQGQGTLFVLEKIQKLIGKDSALLRFFLAGAVLRSWGLNDERLALLLLLDVLRTEDSQSLLKAFDPLLTLGMPLEPLANWDWLYERGLWSKDGAADSLQIERNIEHMLLFVFEVYEAYRNSAEYQYREFSKSLQALKVLV